MPDPKPREPYVADELLRRATEDQYARGMRERGPNVAEDSALMRTVDTANTAALERILDTYGWPDISMVGEQAATAAWLIAQHAPLTFQLRALRLVVEASAHGEAPAWHAAYLADRILMRQGEQQVYGTQYLDQGNGRGMRLWDVIDPARLDERRAEVGLGPVAAYESQVHATYAHRDQAPTRRAPSPSDAS